MRDIRHPEIAAVPDRSLAAAPHVAVGANPNDTLDVAEAERRRMALLLQSNVIDPLSLLLAQTNAYEQTLGTHQPTRLALSVLASLARQVLQQARDLEDNLKPTVLDELGLEPALDALASQVRRVHGLQVILVIARLQERPPRVVELALFRAAQDALDRVIVEAHARRVQIRLERRDEQLILTLSDDGVAPAGEEALHEARRRIVQLGGTVETRVSPHGGLECTIAIIVAPPATLTPRELEVLRLLAEGLSNKAIAGALGVSPRTINFHLDNLYTKLGVASRTEAAVYALRQGWARPE
jgi:DNA-binding CsgD family transcriptional regulator/signal transduction histidine kinase